MAAQEASGSAKVFSFPVDDGKTTLQAETIQADFTVMATATRARRSYGMMMCFVMYMSEVMGN